MLRGHLDEVEGVEPSLARSERAVLPITPYLSIGSGGGIRTRNARVKVACDAGFTTPEQPKSG